MRGDLEVEIAEGERAWRIDAASIGSEVDRIEPSDRDDETPESLRKAIDLAEWAMAQEPGSHIEAPVNAGSKEALEAHGLGELRQRFDGGDRLAFRLTMSVRRKNGNAVPGAFCVYLERDDDLNRGHDYFVRGHLRIPGMDWIEQHPARALVFVDGGSELGNMLRDSEGPAHNRWDPDAKRLTEHWVGARTRVRGIREAARTLLRHLLAEGPQERQTAALADLFPAQRATGDGAPRNADSRKSRERRTEKPDVPPLPRSSADIGMVDGGFLVRAPDSRDLTGTAWRLAFAYDVLRGDPFKRYKSGKEAGYPDFEIADLRIEAQGCEHEPDGDNALRVRVTASDFGIAVKGFDHRDVVVDFRRIDGAPDADAAG